ncbi:hypothetical protein, partial [Solemya pervernicosa gill symbiont]|uniref:hypothetical protein n=1 Tax=Solemya pervernicosa gill symbiont TaxID=642797 RepID=UPI001F2BDD24
RGAAGINGRVKYLPLAWAWMPKTSFRKNSDSPNPLSLDTFVIGCGVQVRHLLPESAACKCSMGVLRLFIIDTVL